MFYGRLTDVYLGVITLVVTLILFKFINSTAGSAVRDRQGSTWAVTTAFPVSRPLNVPGNPDAYIWGDAYYYFCAVALVIDLSFW